MGFWKETGKLTWAVTKLTAQATSLAAKGVGVTAKTVYDNRCRESITCTTQEIKIGE